ncbi:MAG: DUF3658 domain-containing protein [Oscillospiraceae bacterium]
MIEIVFSDSACGSLKAAQHYGQGKYIGGCTGVIFSNKDGSEPTQEQMKNAQKTAEEQIRLEWEKATPMGGNPQDVFGFHLMLSIGDIQKEDFANRRQKAIDTLWSIYPDDPSDVPLDIATELKETLSSILDRAMRGEDIRIWYSNQPDEYCGLYWIMSELKPFEAQLGAVYIVKLPEYEYRDNNAIVSCTAWGEVSPGEWYRYMALAEMTTSVFRRHCAEKWAALQAENAPLRAVLNGKPVSVPENIYDNFILREIEAECDEFHEANLIGRVLGKYQLGIGDAWVALRIEKMIRDGKLTIVSAAAKDRPIYHKMLRKAHIK